MKLLLKSLHRVYQVAGMTLMLGCVLSMLWSYSSSAVRSMARKSAITKALKIDPATARKAFAECRQLLEEEKSMKESLGGRMVDLPQAGPVIQSYEPVFVKVAPGMVWVSFSGEWTRKSKAFAFEYVAKESEEAKRAGVQKDQLWMRNPNGDRVIYEEVE